MTRRDIPPFANEAEERAFWEATDSTDYVDWGAAERVRLPSLRPDAADGKIRLAEKPEITE